MPESQIDRVDVELSVCRIFNNPGLSKRTNYAQWVSHWVSFFLILLGGIVLLFLLSFNKSNLTYDAIVGIGCSLIAAGALTYIIINMYIVIRTNLAVRNIYRNNISDIYYQLFKKHSEYTVTSNHANQFIFTKGEDQFSFRLFHDRSFINLTYNNKKQIAEHNSKQILNHKYHFSVIYFFYTGSTFYQSLVIKIVKYISAIYTRDVALINQYLEKIKI